MPTNSSAAVKLGKQEPRLLRTPAGGVESLAEDYKIAADAYGLSPDPWQYLVADAWLRLDRRGRWTATRCGLAVPRQNGKNGLLEGVELFFMLGMGMRVLHTAHEFKTAAKAWRRMRDLFTDERNFPELVEKVAYISSRAGQEGIYLKSDREGERYGASIEFVARTKNSGRGYTVDVLVCDEAQALTDEQLETLLPTISAAPSGNPLQILQGTPPGPTVTGEVFPRMRRHAVANSDPRLVWAEWSVEEIGDVTDRRRWYDTNPALGIRLDERTIEGELAAMTAAGFARERLGWWAPTVEAATRLITAEEWESVLTTTPPVDGTRSFGVAFNYDGDRLALAGSVKHPDGVHLELIGTMAGTLDLDQVADWLAARWRNTAEILISGAAGAETLYLALRERGVPTRVARVASGRDYFSSTAMLYADIKRGAVTFPRPATENDLLAASVAVCDKKPRPGGTWSWQATHPDGDETPLEAAGLALLAAKTTKRRPGRRQKVL